MSKQILAASELEKQLGKSVTQLERLSAEFADAENRMAKLSDDYLSGKLKNSDQLTTEQSRMSALDELRRAVEQRIEQQRNELAQAKAIENRADNIKSILQVDSSAQAALAAYRAAQTDFDAAALEHGHRLAESFGEICKSQNVYLKLMAELAPSIQDQPAFEREALLESLFAELRAEGFNGSVVRFDSWQHHVARNPFPYSGFLTLGAPDLPKLEFGDVAWQIQQRAQRIGLQTEDAETNADTLADSPGGSEAIEEINHAE